MTKRHNNFFRFLKYVSPYRVYLLLAILGGVVKFTIPLLLPQLTRYLLDHVLLNPEMS